MMKSPISTQLLRWFNDGKYWLSCTFGLNLHCIAYGLPWGFIITAMSSSSWCSTQIGRNCLPSHSLPTDCRFSPKYILITTQIALSVIVSSVIVQPSLRLWRRLRRIYLWYTSTHIATAPRAYDNQVRSIRPSQENMPRAHVHFGQWECHLAPCMTGPVILASSGKMTTLTTLCLNVIKRIQNWSHFHWICANLITAWCFSLGKIKLRRLSGFQPSGNTVWLGASRPWRYHLRCLRDRRFQAFGFAKLFNIILRGLSNENVVLYECQGKRNTCRCAEIWSVRKDSRDIRWR